MTRVGRACGGLFKIVLVNDGNAYRLMNIHVRVYVYEVAVQFFSLTKQSTWL